MADDPYAQFDQDATDVGASTDETHASAAAAPHDPYAQFNPSHPEGQKSFGLGFYEGAMKPFDRAAEAMAHIPVIGPAIDRLGKLAGLPTTDEAVQGHQEYVAQQERAGYTPGPVGEFAGNVAATVPLTLATKNPYLVGAGTGALLSDRDDVSGVLQDTALGAAGGKFADLGLNALGRVAKPLATSAVRRVGQWTGNYSPVMRAADQAADYVSGLLGSAAKKASDLRQASVDALNKPLTAAEAAGRPAMAALTALGRRSGITPDRLSALLQERAAGTPDRILADYAQAAGVLPEAAKGDIDALVQQGRTDARPLFDSALSTPGPIWNDDLRRLVQRPVIRKAISSAAEDLKNADMKPGVWGLPSGADDQTLLPTAQAWDLVKKRLGQSVERDAFGRIIPDTASPGNYNINQANHALTGALRKAIPGYGEALDAAGDYLGLQKAFQNGQNFILKSTLTASQMAAHFSGLSESEQQAFRGGVANKLFDLAQNSQLKPAMFNRPMLREKIGAVLGNGGSDFLDRMKVESMLARTGARMAPGTNSVTSDVLNATTEQDQNYLGALIHGLYAGARLAHGDGLWGGAHVLSALRNLGVVGRATTMPVEVRDEAGRLLMMKPEELADYLSTAPARYGAKSIDSVAKLLGSIKPAARIGGATAAVDLTAVPPETGDRDVGGGDGGNGQGLRHGGKVTAQSIDGHEGQRPIPSNVPYAKGGHARRKV